MNDIWHLIGALGQVGGALVLLGALYYADQQFRKSKEQHDLDRKQLDLNQIIAWKNSALDLNDLAMRYPDTFKEVLYPRCESAEEVRRLTAAYSSLHALEVMYHVRKGDEQEPDRLDIFLREYVSSPELRAAWKVDAAQMAFTKEFQERLNMVIDKHPLVEPPPAPKRSQDIAAIAHLTGTQPAVVIYDPDEQMGQFGHQIKVVCERAGVRFLRVVD